MSRFPPYKSWEEWLSQEEYQEAKEKILNGDLHSQNYWREKMRMKYEEDLRREREQTAVELEMMKARMMHERQLSDMKARRVMSKEEAYAWHTRHHVDGVTLTDPDSIVKLSPATPDVQIRWHYKITGITSKILYDIRNARGRDWAEKALAYLKGEAFKNSGLKHSWLFDKYYCALFDDNTILIFDIHYKIGSEPEVDPEPLWYEEDLVTPNTK